MARTAITMTMRIPPSPKERQEKQTEKEIAFS